mgnify:CR=1 FL=1
MVGAEAARVSARGIEGDPLLIEASGLEARVLQHEIDHLDGVLFIDHISKLKRNVILRKLQKTKKQLKIETMADA